MARIYLRGRTYWLDASAQGKRLRRSLRTTDRLEAERRASSLGTLDAPRSTQEALALYEDHSRARRSPKSHSSAFGALRQALKDLQTESPDQLRPGHVEDYLVRRAHAGAAPKTLNNVRSELSVFFGWLEGRGWVLENPIRKTRPFHVPAPRISFLESDDIKRLQGALDGSAIEAVALCILWAGLRRSEAVWLTEADLDLERGLLSVRAKEGWQPKTRRNRIVPLSRNLRRLLEDHPVGEEWLFRSPRGRRWCPDNLSARFRSAMDGAGLPWTLLDLRHTFATHLIRKPGMTFAKVAALMGNSPEICRKHYAHIATEELVHDIDF